MALRRGRMFRNFENAEPSIFVDDLSLHQILENGTAPYRSHSVRRGHTEEWWMHMNARLIEFYEAARPRYQFLDDKKQWY